MATKAAAQYGGGGDTTGRGSGSGTYNAPEGGYRSATGAGIAAGAATGATALFLALHDHGRVIDYLDWREQNASFPEMGAFTILEGFNLSGDGGARRIQ
jgi:hypothetical protein